MKKPKTRFGAVLLALVAVAFVTGIPYIWIAVALLLLYEGISYLTVTRGTQALRAAVELKENGEEGKPLSGKVVLKGEKGSILNAAAKMNVEVENLFTGELAVLPVDIALTPFGARGYKFRIEEPRFGRLQARVKDIQLQDPMKHEGGHVAQQPHAEALIYPSISEVEIPEDCFSSYNLESYIYAPDRPGSDRSESEGVRSYQAGDPVGAIHWKLSAKTGDTLVRIPALPVGNRILLILDNAMAGGLRATPVQKGRLADIFFSFSHTLLTQDRPHTVCWLDPAQGLQLREVVTTDDLLIAAAQVGAAGFPDGRGSMVQAILQGTAPGAFTTFLFVTTDNSQDLRPLQARGAVKEIGL